MERKKYVLVLVSVVSSLFLASCRDVNTMSSSVGTMVGDTIKIGLNFEESGSVAAYGSAEKKGAELAVKEINNSGGIDGKKLEIFSKDNKSETTESATVATSLVSQDRVNIIIGPATSGAAAAALTSANKAAVPMITPSGTQDNLTIRKNGTVQDYIYRAIFQDSYQGQVIAKYAFENLNGKKAVLFFDKSSDYAKGIAEKFKEDYKGEIVVESSFSSGDKDFSASLTSLKDKDFDVFVLPGYYTETGLITKQARDVGITVPIIGGDGFNDVKYVETATPSAATDVYYVSGFSTKVNLTNKALSFASTYKKEYGETPSMFAALAYDSVYMAAQAAKGATNSKDIAKNLSKIKNFEGVTGVITMDEFHNSVKETLIVGLKNGEETTTTVIKP